MDNGDDEKEKDQEVGDDATRMRALVEDVCDNDEEDEEGEDGEEEMDKDEGAGELACL